MTGDAPLDVALAEPYSPYGCSVWADPKSRGRFQVWNR
jgi:hypothetical protein